VKIVLGDIEVAFSSHGEGPAVVLIHGLAEDHPSWAAVQKALPGYHTYAYDLRGHGETTLGAADGTLAQLGNDLLTFLEKVTGPAICVGYSLGGTVVLWAAAAKPHLITRVVVAGTSSVVGRKAGEFFEQRMQMIGSDFPAFAEALRSDTAAQLVAKPEAVDQVAKRRLKAVGDGGGYINAAEAMRKLVSEPLAPILSKIRCPVDVIGGEKDSFCPPKAAEILISGLRDAQYVQIAGAGHLMSIDNPAAYAAAIKQSLDRSAKK
jgi:pimeloyl-ACP methyl ester carboxylesterase